MARKETVQVLLDDETVRQIEEIAQADGSSKSAVIRRMVLRGLEA